MLASDIWAVYETARRGEDESLCRGGWSSVTIVFSIVLGAAHSGMPVIGGRPWLPGRDGGRDTRRTHGDRAG